MNGSIGNTAEAVSPEIYQLARDQYHYLRTEKHFMFMENAGGSQVPDVVADAVRDHFRESCAQLYAGYPLSSKSTQKVEEAHEVAKYMVNAHDVGEVVIGPSSSNLFLTLANCYRKILKPGDEIVLHEASHESNIGPWIELASQGVVIKWWKVDPKTGDSSLHDLKSVLSSKTKLVAVTHVSNLLGDILNLPAVVAEVHAVGAKLVVDGVAYAPHRSIDVKSWGVDWYTFSVYKVYGPHMAVLFGRREAFDELANAKAGPNWFFIDQHEIPYKYEVGSANHEACSGLAALPKYFATLLGLPQDTLVSRELIERAFALMTRMEQPLQEKFLGFLSSKPDVRLCGSKDPAATSRVPTFSFAHSRLSSTEIVQHLHKAGVGCRNGHMYAYRLSEAMGFKDLNDGVVRISMAHYNTPDEVDRIIKALDQIL